jgi:hypothetical protein
MVADVSGNHICPIFKGQADKLFILYIVVSVAYFSLNFKNSDPN